MSIIRTGAKRAAEAALRLAGVPAIARRWRKREVLVLAYHNIVPHGSDAVGDRSLHLSQSAFAAQLDALLATHDVIPLNDVLTHAVPNPTRPRAAITFDDAYSGAMTAGMQELLTRQLPATVFITPSFLDGRSFWWDTLADCRRGLDGNVRERALSERRGLNDEVLALAAQISLSTHDMPTYARGASISQLNSALEYDKITFGAHTWSHPNLTSLSDTELTEELQRTRAWLQRFGERSLSLVSYPYGLADRRVQSAAHDAGYTAGFMINGGWTVDAPSDRFAIPRMNVPAGVSIDGFVLRTSGLIKG